MPIVRFQFQRTLQRNHTELDRFVEGPRCQQPLKAVQIKVAITGLQVDLFGLKVDKADPTISPSNPNILDSQQACLQIAFAEIACSAAYSTNIDKETNGGFRVEGHRCLPLKFMSSRNA